MMNRRSFLCTSAGIILASTRLSTAQQTKMYRVGVLTAGAAAAERKRFDDLTQGLNELGYFEGRNIQVERRFAEGRFGILPALATDLVQQKVDVIVCMSTLATQAAKTATSIIPIVFATVADPVGEGFVGSLARPGGNITGISTLGTALSGKVLQLLKDAFPTTSRVAVFTAPRAPHAAAQLAELESAARTLRMEILVTQVQRPDDFEPVLAWLRDVRADAMYVMQGAENSALRPLLVKIEQYVRLPAVFPQRNYVEAGGLLSYGPDFDSNYRRAASYVDKILRGAKPADLPVEQPTKFELVVNLKTAKALGLSVPQSLLLRADQVIQ